MKKRSSVCCTFSLHVSIDARRSIAPWVRTSARLLTSRYGWREMKRDFFAHESSLSLRITSTISPLSPASTPTSSPRYCRHWMVCCSDAAAARRSWKYYHLLCSASRFMAARTSSLNTILRLVLHSSEQHKKAIICTMVKTIAMNGHRCY